jgi:hypothetical protein
MGNIATLRLNIEPYRVGDTEAFPRGPEGQLAHVRHLIGDDWDADLEDLTDVFRPKITHSDVLDFALGL